MTKRENGRQKSAKTGAHELCQTWAQKQISTGFERLSKFHKPVVLVAGRGKQWEAQSIIGAGRMEGTETRSM